MTQIIIIVALVWIIFGGLIANIGKVVVISASGEAPSTSVRNFLTLGLMISAPIMVVSSVLRG